MAGRCGDCTVCCTLSNVPEVNKKPGEKCKHCVNKGCSIYDKRPQVCRDFECAYLQSNADNVNLRPDKCGMMFFKKSERIFCGAIVPDTHLTDIARNQIDAFNRQGYSVIILELGAKPQIQLAPGHMEKDIREEYINLLKDGNV